MWLVRLKGEDNDLRDLNEQLPGNGAIAVVSARGEWFLTGPDIDSSPDPRTAWERAEKRLPFLIVGGQLSDGRRRDVAVDGLVTDGQGGNFMFALAGSVTAQGTAHHATTGTDRDGPKSPRRRTPMELLLDLDPNVPEVEEVARLLAGGRSPVDLYKVFEIIRDQSGRDFRGHAWVTAAEQSRFTLSMNHEAASGDDARHARLGTQPPEHPMDIHEARAFIDAQVLHWLEDLAAQHGVALTDS